MKYRKRTMLSKSKKIMFIITALPLFATAYAADNTQNVSRASTAHAQTAQHEIPNQPKKGWKISAKDYAELVDDCGDSNDSGREGRASSARGSRRQSE